MLKRMLTHCGDDTRSSCVVAGDYIFLAHHAGGFDRDDIVHRMKASFNSLRNTLESVGATLDDMVQISLYFRKIEDLPKARDVFYRYFKDGFPACMTATSDFVSPACSCMLDEIGYKKS